MSRKAGGLLSSTRGKSLGTRLSFVSHQRITTIGFGRFQFERVYFFGGTLYVVIMFFIKKHNNSKITSQGDVIDDTCWSCSEVCSIEISLE
jgi:hypothetical protein